MRGRPPGGAKGNVLEVRGLTAEDLRSPLAPRYDAISVIRDRHHAMARLLAQGCTPREIAEVLGCSMQSVQVLSRDPAIAELIAEYRAEVDETARPVIDETNRLFNKARLLGSRMIVEDLEEHDAAGTRPPLQRLVQIVEFSSDRTGYAKQTVQVRFDGDFASKLDFARQRSAKVIEGRSLLGIAASAAQTEEGEREREPPSLRASPPPCAEGVPDNSARLSDDRPLLLRPRPAPAVVEARGRAVSAGQPSLRRRWA